MSFITELDYAVHDWFVEKQTPGVTPIMRWGTDLADWAFVTTAVILISAYLVYLRRPRAILFLVFSTLGGKLVGEILKAVIDRDRPPIEDHLVSVGNQALPSGHALQAAAFYGAVALLVASHAKLRNRSRMVWSAVAVIIG